MNCAQVAKVISREDEIKEKIAECMSGYGSVVHHSESGSGSESDPQDVVLTHKCLPSAKRFGKALPVDCRQVYGRRSRA